MKKVLIIALAVMCVAACGPRRSGKSQENQKDACQKEVVEHKCCGHASEGACPSEETGEKCPHASVSGECQHTHEAVKECAEKAEQCAKETKECAKEAAKEGAATVEQLERQTQPKPVKPVPNPYKK
ncbi:MAG: hypothetical protein J6X77_04440 [Bacteroidales bacterium]|nr:hypothetical protein [Bacteroidales bacterium]